MTVEAKWVGGPHDGSTIAVESDFAEAWEDTAPITIPGLTETMTVLFPSERFKIVRVPVHLTKDGYRLYWSERVRVR